MFSVSKKLSFRKYLIFRPQNLLGSWKSKTIGQKQTSQNQIDMQKDQNWLFSYFEFFCHRKHVFTTGFLKKLWWDHLSSRVGVSNHRSLDWKINKWEWWILVVYGSDSCEFKMISGVLFLICFEKQCDTYGRVGSRFEQSELRNPVSDLAPKALQVFEQSCIKTRVQKSRSAEHPNTF